jgi:hypothetical protein
MVLTTRRLRRLNLQSKTGPAFLSAASGLVRAGAYIYVIADDELDLGVFPASGAAPGRLHRLFKGALPVKKKARKKHKPDLEALALLPPTRHYRHGALLVLGSGSRGNRRRAALLHLDADGALSGKPELLDLTPLYRPLEARLRKLNIEGALVLGQELLLFQRGNKGGPNAVIHTRLAPALTALKKGSGKIAFTIQPHDLGDIDGVPLGFTDAAPLPGGAILFTAAAEATDNAYDDGPCRGSAIGLLDARGKLKWQKRLKTRIKVEGVHATRDGNMIDALLVSDADDASVPAGLYRAKLAL